MSATETPAFLVKVREHFLVSAEVIVAFAILGLLFIYLIPKRHLMHPPKPLEPSEEDYLLDCFIVRDASMSASADHEMITQISTRLGLKTQVGDRVSYSLFGTDVIPNPIQSPTDNDAIIATQIEKYTQKTQVYSTTDFALLFQRLNEAVHTDRKAREKVELNHADAIIVFSDGIPDLTKNKSTCPLPGAEFISDEIVDAVDKLIKDVYATQESIYVRLVLLGTPKDENGIDCGGQIEQGWKTRLQDIAGFEVLLYSGLQASERNLLKPLRRHPRVIVSLAPPSDQERRALDEEGKFSIPFLAQAYRETGRVTVESGILVPRLDDDEEHEKSGVAGTHEIRLLALADPEEDYIPKNRVVINPPPPVEGNLGNPVRSRIYFKLENHSDRSRLRENGRYDLRLEYKLEDDSQLEADSKSAAESLPPTLTMEPCSSAREKKLLEARLKRLAIVPVMIGLLFLAGCAYWGATGADDGQTSLVRNRIVSFLVYPYQRWIGVFLVFLLPIAGGMLYLGYGTMLVVMGLLLGLAVFYLKEVESPIFKLLVFTIEFLLLPLIHLMIAAAH